MLGGSSLRTGETIGIWREEGSDREHSSTEMEKTAALYHFPFDDHEENS